KALGKEKLGKEKIEKSKETIAALVQILQGQEEPFRAMLVRVLAKSEEPTAIAALARIALFDLSFDVREAAVKALQPRARKEYRQVLLDGLRYPWAPVADHAAEALVTLKDREAVPAPVELLDKPDPAAPFLNAEKKYVVPELVRINHLSNCILCHAAASTDSREPLRGLVPTPGKPIPKEVYYDSPKGIFVRADVTYLKQDFSVLHPVPEPNHWPAIQRFDYFIRQRELNAAEAEKF